MLTTLKDEQFDELYQLFEESFPQDEFRSYTVQKGLLDRENYNVYIYEQNQDIAAFFAVWETEDFVFLEHFAVREAYRNGGLGGKLLKHMLEEVNKPVIIEVEPPDDELKQRRVAFYERNGFHFSSYGYIQPALGEDRQPMPLNVMAYPQPLNDERFYVFKDWIFAELYN
ncbi:GNAT family N-acetyltransferase [Shouchella sp. JSM 1781072]|uniref:GNAT family N-acetyltransferase n=1 Tax=Bacillaceae TaxID=186817 RepID=UPI00159B8B0E|nr:MULTISPECIES: GNAT family N-acetyltransferase [Bacillaceae]UTR06908.1 GNAT family N-acetyltransferase [Alkalihalobacillus sp. LMS6]